MSAALWREDLLGGGFRRHDLDLGEDSEGALRAVAIRHLPGSWIPVDGDPRIPLLFIHGWSDYVLDREFLELCSREGFDVWGVDLRKHGRSLLPGQTPTAISDLDEYDAELTAMLDLIGRRRPPVLVAHSTGGLTATLWALRHPGTVRGLILNSPWLEFHAGPRLRRLLQPGVRGLARIAPGARILPRGSDHYARSIHALFDGEADYSLIWKPPGGHAFPASTMAAVLEGQSRLRSAGPLEVPALILRSQRSRIPLRYRPGLSDSDVVLNVRTMARAAAGLGPLVREVPLEGARHDVLLSPRPVRDRATAEILQWLRELPERTPTMEEADETPGRCAVPETTSSPRDLAVGLRRSADRLTMIRLRLSRALSQVAGDDPVLEALHAQWIDAVYPQIGEVVRRLRSAQRRLEGIARDAERSQGRRMGGYRGAGYLGRGDGARDHVEAIIAFGGAGSGARIGGFPLAPSGDPAPVPHASEVLGEVTPEPEDE